MTTTTAELERSGAPALNRERRRLADRRAHAVRRAALAHGLNYCVPLVLVLADYGALSDVLPYPSQERLADDLGRSVRQVRRQTAALAALGLVLVYVAPPVRHRDGTYSRQTNRYLLCDRRAGAVRRRVNGPVGPTGHARPVIPTGKNPAGSGARRRIPTPARETACGLFWLDEAGVWHERADLVGETTRTGPGAPEWRRPLRP